MNKPLKDGYITLPSASEYLGISKEETQKRAKLGDIELLPGRGSGSESVCKKSLERVFAKELEEKNCKKLNLAQAAKFLKINRIEFYKLIEAGIFKTTGEGFDAQIKVSDLEDYLNKST